MQYFTVRGTPFEIGAEIGKRMQKVIKHRLKLVKINPEKVRYHKDKLQYINQLCFIKYPRFIEELKGYSAGSGVDYWQLLMLNCAGFGTDHGCSSIAISSNETLELAHNEDGSDFESPDNCALIQYQLKEVSFHSLVYAGELAGNAFNWNSAGIYFTVNSIPTNKIDIKIPRYFTARALCEAKSLTHALNLLRKSEDASGFHYFIGDSKNIYSVEHYQDKTGVMEVKGTYAHTNHYLLPKFAKYSHPYLDSIARVERIKELLPDKDLLTILSDRKNLKWPLFSKGEAGKRTLAQVIIKPKEKKVSIFDRGKVSYFRMS